MSDVFWNINNWIEIVNAFCFISPKIHHSRRCTINPISSLSFHYLADRWKSFVTNKKSVLKLSWQWNLYHLNPKLPISLKGLRNLKIVRSHVHHIEFIHSLSIIKSANKFIWDQIAYILIPAGIGQDICLKRLVMGYRVGYHISVLSWNIMHKSAMRLWISPLCQVPRSNFNDETLTRHDLISLWNFIFPLRNVCCSDKYSWSWLE